jgi:exonuclease III
MEKHMGFGTWNVKSLYMLGSRTAVARELERCKLDLVCVEEVRWDKGDAGRAGGYIFF